MAASSKRLSSYWWFPILFDVIFILTGIWILSSPIDSYIQISRVIGVILLISGAIQIFLATSRREELPGWAFQATGGLIDVVIGIVLMVNPVLLLKIITLFVGIWLIVNSVKLIVRAIESRKTLSEVWKWELAYGLALLLLAILFIWHPMIIGFTIAIWTALALILLGIFRIALTLRMRSQLK
jgi:uncharacterized membrane protein HdeD (DUF308 family)